MTLQSECSHYLMAVADNRVSYRLLLEIHLEFLHDKLVFNAFVLLELREGLLQGLKQALHVHRIAEVSLLHLD